MGPGTVDVGRAGIRLGQLLKLAGVAGSGACARDLLAAEDVRVNGVVERRRGRQLGTGDVVVVTGPGGEVRLRVG